MLHRPAKRNFIWRLVFILGLLEQFQSDLVIMSMFEGYNKGDKWILMTVDMFTKKVLAVPVKRKSATNMVAAFE